MSKDGDFPFRSAFHKKRRVMSSSPMPTSFLWGLLSILCWILIATAAEVVDHEERGFLDEQSVILITGAAGFLGSELALALFRTYHPKKILCVDRMGDHPSTQEELALFEFQRQRSFNVLQTLGLTGKFFRIDIRPMIPEYFDLGEVPALDYIFRDHPDITHVVHFADPYPHAALQVVSREVEVPKAGMMEALLEQLLKIQREGGDVPHFLYASSSEVYPRRSTTAKTMPRPLEETDPISTPSSIRGAAKLMDELLAKLYYDQHGLYSVGLRFFSVYGPWGVPGSALFEMAERAVTGENPLKGTDDAESLQDFVYIDDAIDAVMSAMQFRPTVNKPHPVIFNVASGQGTSLSDIANVMKEYFPQKNNFINNAGNQRPAATTFGSIERAKRFLGYEPRVSLRDGLTQLLAWHYDRAYPYGGRQLVDAQSSNPIASKGIVSCLPNDEECLKAAPVFPCASECSHEAQCINSFYDEVIGWSQALTAKCSTVLYTVDFNPSLEFIPSAHVRIQTQSKSFLEGTCNLAFVADNSPLVQSLRQKSKTFMSQRSDNLLKHGKWILVPVMVPSFTPDEGGMMTFLPKLSPGLFFSNSVSRAIYCDPNILLDSIPKLLREASVQPFNDEQEGATAMLIGRGKPKDYFGGDDEDDDDDPKPQVRESTKSFLQNAAYRMIRIAVSDKLFGDGFMALLDSRWMVHKLQSDDSRLFRCDVYGEVVQWEVDSDKAAVEFVLGLHDMWSRVIAGQSGTTGPWWIGENVRTVPEGYSARRRLLEMIDGEIQDSEDVEQENVEVLAEEAEEGNEVAQEAREKLDEGAPEGEQTEDEADNNQDAAVHDAEGVDDDNNSQPEDESRLGFGGETVTDEVNTAGDKKHGESSEEEEDDEEEEGAENDLEQGEGQDALRDFSSYDTWMGILSASSVKYFVRIVPSAEVGVVSLDDYDKQSAQS